MTEGNAEHAFRKAQDAYPPLSFTSSLPPSPPATTDPELDGHSFIAVYDGHGGQYSAIYCGEQMISFLKKTKGFEDYKKTKDVAHLQVCFSPQRTREKKTLKELRSHPLFSSLPLSLLPCSPPSTPPSWTWTRS